MLYQSTPVPPAIPTGGLQCWRECNKHSWAFLERFLVEVLVADETFIVLFPCWGLLFDPHTFSLQYFQSITSRIHSIAVTVCTVAIRIDSVTIRIGVSATRTDAIAIRIDAIVIGISPIAISIVCFIICIFCHDELHKWNFINEIHYN